MDAAPTGALKTLSDSPADFKFFSPANARAASNAIWNALERHEIPYKWVVVLEHLLWRSRINGRDRSSISITALRDRTRVQRQDVIDALRYAHVQGWLRKINRRLKVYVPALRRCQERQAVSLFIWQKTSEYGGSTALDRYNEKELRMLRKEARKDRGRGVVTIAVRLAQIERENPAALAVIGDAVRTVMEGPRQGFAEALAALPFIPTPTPSVRPTVNHAEPAYNQSLIDSVRRQRFSTGI